MDPTHPPNETTTSGPTAADIQAHEADIRAPEASNQNLVRPLVMETEEQMSSVAAILENYEKLIAMETADYQRRLELLEAEHADRVCRYCQIRL